MAHARESQTLGAPLVIHLLFKKINQIFFFVIFKKLKIKCLCIIIII